MNDLTKDEQQVMNELAEMERKGRLTTRVNNRAIVSVYIRGVAFRCGSGSRREQILRSLKDMDSQDSFGFVFLAVVAVVAWSAGFATAWWLI